MHRSLRPLSLALSLTALAVATSPVAAQTCGVAGEVFAQCPGSLGFSASDVSAGVLSADDFSLAAPATVTTVRWWGSYADAAGTAYCGPQPDTFTVMLWGDTGGSGPDNTNLLADLSSLPVARSAAPVMSLDVGGASFAVFEYELDLSATPVSLAAGTVYWLQVHADLSAFPNCTWVWVLDPPASNGFYTYFAHWPSLPPWHFTTTPTATPGFDFSFALLESAGVGVSYCTAGTSKSGCTATLGASGTPSATAATGFQLAANGVEGNKDGLFFLGTNGRQANAWGNGTSFQCVVPPVKRAGILAGTGTNGACDGVFSQDLNARWQAFPAQNPGAGAVVQGQLWYRDPQNTSNQTTSLSDAIEFTVGP